MGKTITKGTQSFALLPEATDFSTERELAGLRARVCDLEGVVEKADSKLRPIEAFNGMSIEQVLLVLGEIATTAGSLMDMCRVAAADAGRTDAATDLHVAQMLAERIGAIADQVRGNDIRGELVDWMVGGSFREEIQREASHA